MLGTACLDFESFRTIIYTCVGYVNARPIGVIQQSNEVPLPVSPHMLTSGRDLHFFPIQKTIKPDSTLSKKMHLTKTLLNAWWKNWIHYYLQELSIRRRWKKQSPVQLKVGQVVMLNDSQAKFINRNNYKIAVIEEIFESADGLQRRVKVRTPNGSILNRAVQSLCFFEHDIDQPYDHECKSSCLLFSPSPPTL